MPPEINFKYFKRNSNFSRFSETMHWVVGGRGESPERTKWLFDVITSLQRLRITVANV